MNETNLQPYQQRVIDEKAELDVKIQKLTEFLSSDKSESVEADEKDRMKWQLDIMEDYSEVLGERIANFPSV